MTHETMGSGMLCVENDDDSAALQCQLLASVDLMPADLTPWNDYPWYRHDQSSGLRSPQITEGLNPLARLIDLMPKLKSYSSKAAKRRPCGSGSPASTPESLPGMRQ
ncbi:hypothetical protein ACIP9X_19025 [Arthrobacter sp. NPDC093125]|uniref:hypothetical protein n=1 Tax=Arthrobacter sp. NPDC093125 TaxID=3363944 RepID=UPI003815F5E9